MENVILEREISEELWEELIEIFNNSPMANRNLNELKLAFRNSTLKCFLFYDNKLVGCGRALSDDVYQAALYDIVVHHEFRRKGLGSIITKYLIKNINAKNIILYAVPGVEPFYKKLGFKKLKTGMGKFNSGLANIEKGYLE
jgi:N-acetylglutamate synthase-like GNAT family acetyltransferase